MIEVLIAAGKAIAVLAALALLLFGLWAIVSNQPLHLTHESPPPRRGTGSPVDVDRLDEATADTGDSSPPPTEQSDHEGTEEPPPSTPPPDEPGPPTAPEP